MPTPPVSKMSKEEICRLSRMHCKHGMPYIAHYSCWLKDKPDKSVGVFDIETSHLKASLGVLLCYKILDLNTKKIIGRTITKREVLSPDCDKKIVRECVRDMAKFDRLITYYGCLTPGHKILTSELNWVPVETLKPNDELIGFDVEPVGMRRHFKKSIVIHNIPIKKQTYKIFLSDGKILESSFDHPWLVKRGGLWLWKTPEQLIHFNGNNYMHPILDTWENNDSYTAGYLAGYWDGEGGIYQCVRKERPDFTLCISSSQHNVKNLNVVNEVKKNLEELGIHYLISHYDKDNYDQVSITISKGLNNKLRFLGIVQPTKLNNLDINKIGSLGTSDKPKPVHIETVEKSRTKEVCGLQTSSETYIGEGFGCHNSGFDLKFIRTRAVMTSQDFPDYGEIVGTDLYYMVRNRFALHSNRLQTACEVLLGKSDKTSFDVQRWRKALQGDKESLSYIDVHCANDVKDTAKLYEKVNRFSMETKTSI